MKHPQYARRLCHALDRLHKSKTKLTRQRARNALRSELRAIQKQVLEEFPPLSDDGAARKTGRRWRNCPVCGAPFPNSVKLCEHLRHRHHLIGSGWRKRSGLPGEAAYKCECCGKDGLSPAGMIRHLEAAGWRAHVALHALKGVGNAF